MSPGDRREVLVLHSLQQIGRGLTAALSVDDYAVRVITSAPEQVVLRPDAPRDRIEIETVTDEWRRTTLPQLVSERDLEVVTNDELCLEECSRLRTATGRDAIPLDQLSAYGDKVELKRRLRDAGVPVPRSALLELDQVADDAAAGVVASVGLPVVVKPRRGAYNIGVGVMATTDELQEWMLAHRGERDWHVESFASGRLCHANAIVADGRVTPVIVGAYTGPPLGLGRGAALGSVTVPGSHPLRDVGFELLHRITAVLGAAGRFVLHAEFFFDGEQATVIDVATRAPGGLVSDIAELAAGVNLEEASFRLQTGADVPDPVDTGVAAGWAWWAGRVAPRTAFVAWNRDFDQLVGDLGAAVQGGESGTALAGGWLADLRVGPEAIRHSNV